MTHGITNTRNQKLIDFAFEFAAEAHSGQKRKYTDEPYIVHPVAVARLVASRTNDIDMICAAFLHDVIEDTAVTYNDIGNSGFWWTTAKLVQELTDVSRPADGNRAARKAIDRDHLSTVSDMAKTIKLADLIDNTVSIVRHDPKFARVYMHEKSLLLPVLAGGDSVLWHMANDKLDNWRKWRPKQ